MYLNDKTMQIFVLVPTEETVKSQLPLSIQGVTNDLGKKICMEPVSNKCIYAFW